MSDKTYTIAGTSNLNGKVKVRVSNGTIKHRQAVLERCGHTDVQLQELPKAMTRPEAIEFLDSKKSAKTVKVETPAKEAETETESAADETPATAEGDTAEA